MSFGTNVNRGILTPEKLQIMIKVFHGLPYDILMKSDNTTDMNSSKNIRMFNWIPQTDVLRMNLYSNSLFFFMTPYTFYPLLFDYF